MSNDTRRSEPTEASKQASQPTPDNGRSQPMSSEKQAKCPECGAAYSRKDHNRGMVNIDVFECGTKSVAGIGILGAVTDQCKINALTAKCAELEAKLEAANGEIMGLKKLVQYCFTELETTSCDLDDDGYDKLNKLIDTVVKRFKDITKGHPK